MASRNDQIVEALRAAGYSGSLADMERQRLLYEQKLTEPQPLSFNDLYFLNGEAPRLGGRGKGLPLIRRNECQNPNQLGGLSGYNQNWGTGGAGTYGFVDDATAPSGSGKAYNITWTTAPTNQTGGAYYQTPANSVKPGKYSGSMWVKSSVGQRCNMLFYGYDAGSTVLHIYTTDVKVVNPGEWTEFKADFEFTNPATARILMGVYAVAGVGGSIWAVGDSISYSKILIEGSPRNRPYFDGDDPADSDYTYSWEGVANNSPSIATLKS